MSWRAIGDAEWMARLIRKGIKIGACGKLLSSFAFTGQNTSESPLAKEEGARWRMMPDAPSSRWGLFVVWNHRFRKWLAGSYKLRSVRYALHRMGEETGRIIRTADSVGWWWPCVGNNLSAGSEKTVPVIGTQLLVTSYDQLGEKLCQAAGLKQKPLAVDFANTHVVTMRRHEPWFENLAKSMDLTVPDGMPLVWAMNKKGARLKDRVYGPTFTRKFLESCPAGFTHYLVGGSEECGRRFREQMLALNPTLNFIGGYHGRSSEEGVLSDDQAVIKELQEKKPDFIWVGLGTPKQYAWIHRIKPLLGQGVILAVGFAFDVNAGMKPDAPAWMQPMGLTWLYRLASEPGRLAGRYLNWNSLFLCYVVEDILEDLRGQGNQRNDLYKKWKLRLRDFSLKVIDLFASEIKDCVTGEKLGRGLVIGWGSCPIVIGHPGLPPLIPRFLPQKRLTYWKQKICFTTHPRPDFSRLDGADPHHAELDNLKVMNLLLTHQVGEQFERVRECWRGVAPEENLWVAFGGTRENFEKLDYSRKIFVDDPKLRKKDNQREKQCYSGIFKAMASVIEAEKPDYIYLCEYDHLPLIPDLNQQQVRAIRQEEADVMGHWLYRVDGTGHYHELYHESDPDYLPFWKSVSRRENRTVILSMFGSGSFWTREAFLAIANQQQTIECYLEIYLPSLAHHLGFRVRGWRESDHLISNLALPAITMENARNKGCWTVHPVKEISAK
jgi:N-acetylglucosaminyldiphosphoundecaprenol N-acetyl-beta-D-mannosaminyltransferase